MSSQNIQNPQTYIPVQNNNPVQQINGYTVPQNMPAQPQMTQNIPANNYMPRFAPMVQQGQVYPVALPAQPVAGQQGTKAGSVGTVNITINGVNSPLQGANQPASQAVPCCLPYYVPQCIPQQQPANLPAQDIKKDAAPHKEEQIPAAKIENKQEEQKPEAKTNKKPIIELTDAYIQQLEQRLNSKDKAERAHAAAELVTRFKEDETRKNEPRLTNLLNLALQDDSKPVVFMAMQALDNGYANGNKTTLKRLQTIKDANDNYGNAEAAGLLLTRLSANNNAAVSLNDSAENNNKQQGTKLNLMAE